MLSVWLLSSMLRESQRSSSNRAPRRSGGSSSSRGYCGASIWGDFEASLFLESHDFIYGPMLDQFELGSGEISLERRRSRAAFSSGG